MVVVGLGLAGLAVAYLFLNDVTALTAFGMGASSIALFARVGGGIYNRHLNFKTKMLWNVIALCPTFVIKSNLIVNQVVHRKTTSIIY